MVDAGLGVGGSGLDGRAWCAAQRGEHAFVGCLVSAGVELLFPSGFELLMAAGPRHDLAVDAGL